MSERPFGSAICVDGRGRVWISDMCGRDGDSVDQQYVLHHHTGYWVAIITQRSELLAEGAGVDIPHGGGGGLKASCREEKWGGGIKQGYLSIQGEKVPCRVSLMPPHTLIPLHTHTSRLRPIPYLLDSKL